jgi:hypothetical protein
MKLATDFKRQSSYLFGERSSLGLPWIHFSGQASKWGGLNKDSKVRLDGARSVLLALPLPENKFFEVIIPKTQYLRKEKWLK